MSRVREPGFDGSADLPVLRISRGGEDRGPVATGTGHTAGRSAAVVVEVLLVSGLLLAGDSADCGLGPTGLGGPARLSRSRHVGAGSPLQVLSGIRCPRHPLG